MSMRQLVQKWAESVICAAVIVLLAWIALLPDQISQRAPIATERSLFYPPWDEARPANLRAPSPDDPSLVQAQRYYPWYAFLNHAARSGHSLLWNPLEGCGAPFLAVWRTRCLSPFSLPFYAMSMPAALQWSLFLKLLVAGGCAFYAARRLGFAPPLALAAGVAFEFSGPVLAWFGWPMSDVAPWLPLLVLLSERLAFGQRPYWPLGAVTIGLMALGGDPETLSAAILFACVYVCLRLALTRAALRQAAFTLLFLGMSVALGLALAAVQLGPYLEFLGQAAATGHEDSGATLHLKDLAICFLPHWVQTTSGTVHDGVASRNTHVLLLLHVGLLQWLLLPLWFSVRGFVGAVHRRRIDALLLTAVLATALAFGAGRVLARVPGLRLLGPEHFLVGNALALALVSVAAAEAWLELNAEQCKAALRRVLVYGALLAIVGLVSLMAYRGTPRPGTPALWLQIVAAAGFSLALVVLTGFVLFRPSVRIMGYGLAALTVLSLWTAFTPAAGALNRDLVFPRTSFITTIADTGERISGTATLGQWPVAGNLVPQIYCPSGVELRRHATFFERVRTDPMLLRRTGAPALLLTKEDIQGAFAFIRPMLAIRHVFSSGAVLFRDLGSKPRAWVAYDWRIGDALTPGEIAGNLPPRIEGATPPSAPPAELESKVAVTDPDPYTRVAIDVDSPRPGFLILADAFYPGWTATVDGEATPIMPADALFRAVPIKEGAHHVEFIYAPFSYRLGRWITFAAAAVILIELRRLIRERLRKRLRRA